MEVIGNTIILNVQLNSVGITLKSFNNCYDIHMNAHIDKDFFYFIKIEMENIIERNYCIRNGFDEI